MFAAYVCADIAPKAFYLRFFHPLENGFPINIILSKICPSVQKHICLISTELAPGAHESVESALADIHLPHGLRGGQITFAVFL